MLSVMYGDIGCLERKTLISFLSVGTSKQQQGDGDTPGGPLCAGALFKDISYGNRSHEVCGSLQYLFQVTLQLNNAAALIAA